MQILEAITFGQKEIALPSEARLLLSNAIQRSIEFILANPKHSLSENELETYKAFIARRKEKEPIAYILESKEFYGRNFDLNQYVLIPRNDSETLIDAVLSSHDASEKINILELGLGSGCLLITLLMEMKNAYGIGVDISTEALKIAQQNCEKYNLSARCQILQSDWFDNVSPDQKFDLIISNPPYIAENEKSIMSEETILFEPTSALYAENNGLEAYQKIAQKAKDFFSDNGKIFLEIGINQAPEITKIFELNGFILKKQYKDLASIVRVLEFV